MYEEARGFGVLFLLVLAPCVYFWNQFALLHLKTGVEIEVNGHRVPCGILEGRVYRAIVTRRDAGKQHSYLLWYDMDSDGTGNIGTITDCAGWIAPRSPILIITAEYPACALPPPKNEAESWRGHLRESATGQQFVTKDGDLINIKRR